MLFADHTKERRMSDEEYARFGPGPRQRGDDHLATSRGRCASDEAAVELLPGRRARLLKGMKGEPSPYSSRLSGGQALIVAKRPPEGVDLDSFFGPVRVEWDHEAPMTPLGQAPFFVHFLKTAGLFDALVIDFPLRYMRPNAPSKRDFLGTAMLSTLAGCNRYVHIAALRRRAAGAVGDEEDRQRGRDPARLSRRSTRRKGRSGCVSACNLVWSRCWPNRGS